MNNPVPAKEIVRAPHAPLTDYYASEEERRGFLRGIFDKTAQDYDKVERLLAFSELRILAHRWKIASVHLEPPHAVLEYTSRELVDRLKRATAGRIRPVDGRSAYVELKSPLAEADQVIAELQSLLRREL